MKINDRKHKNHDEILKEVYAEIYPDHYTFKASELAHTKAMILKNLDELGIPALSLEKQTVLNVGTGIESVAFQELHAKTVYHFDISDKSVNNLKRLQQENPRFSNLFSAQADMCGDNVVIPEKIDLVYLVGVLHHFYSPLKGIHNILPSVNVGGRLFLRIYRSGGMRAFVADYARKFIDDSCRTRFKDVFCRRFKEFPYGDGVWQHNLPAHLYQIIFDDLFVPTLLFLHPRQIESFFEVNGCSLIQRQQFDEYDHACNAPGFGLISILIKKEHESAIQGRFPDHIDQLEDIEYHDEHIIETQRLMRKRLPEIRDLSPEAKIGLAIDLFWGALAFYLAASDQTIHLSDISSLSTSQGKHDFIQKLLYKF